MLDARRLTTLQAVVRGGSFGAAAAELGYTAPAVSQHVAELERSVGLRLLERRPVRATEAGLVALRAAAAAGEAITAAETVLRALRDGEAGSVRLGAFASAASAVAAPAIAAFRRGNPAVEVSLTQIETPDAYDALIRDRLDLALTFDYDLTPREPPELVQQSQVAEDPILVALPPAHRLASAPSVDLEALSGEAWIAAPLAGFPLTALRAWMGTGFEPRMRFEGDDFQTVLSLVEQGLGIAVLPQLAAHRAPSAVAVRPLAGAPLKRRLYTTRLRTDFPSPAALRLEELITRELRARPT